MDKSSFFSFTFYDLWKLVGATLLFFLGLILGVKPAGEPATMIQVDYFEQEQNSDHPSANLLPPEWALDQLCSSHSDRCEKIIWSGSFTEKEQLSYVSQYFEIFDFLDRHLMKGNDIKTIFQTLIINSEKGKRRGWATQKRITINLDSFSDISHFWGVLTHEFGHVVDLGVLKGLSKTQNGNYTEFGKVKFSVDDPSLEYYRYSRASENIRNAEAEKKDFCSGYGMSNPFEDFAECHNLYLNNKLLFRAMAKEAPIMKNKYNYFANLFNNQSLQEGNQELWYPSWRPWDTTVI